MEKTAFITGASRGIGRQTALTLARSGWRTALFARSAGDLEGLKNLLEEEGREVLVLEGSLEESSQVNAALERVAVSWGRLDLVVNNAGVGGFRPLEEFRAEDWDWMMNTNARGTFFVVKAALPLLKGTPGALVINVESDVARRGFDSGSLYCASKFAQDGFTQALRKELRPLGIRVSAVLPGLTDTSFGNSEEGAGHKKEWLKPADVARIIQFMAESPAHVLIDEITVHPLCQEF